MKLAVVGVLVLIVLLIGGCGVLEHSTEKSVTFKVQDKAIKHTGDYKSGKDQYIIYTDHGVYKDVDTIWFFKFNSSDIYGQLQKGKTYTCKTNGFRIPVFSSYRNILSCQTSN